MAKTTIQKTILIILDGWGIAPAWGGNAVEMAQTPNIDRYWRQYPHTILRAAEEAVGLPRHEPGNSEVGHLNLGSGQIVRQNLPGISATIEDRSFFQNPVLIEAVSHAKRHQSNIHLIGLVSDGGVHSHTSHLFALLDFLKTQNYGQVFIHMFTDGRDTDPMKALSFLAQLEEKIKTVGIGRIESVIGRFYAMDRDNRWERIQQAYDVLTLGTGPKTETAEQAVANAYRRGQYDEFIVPTVVTSEKYPFVPVKDNDTIIFFNFRADRSTELSLAFTLNKFHGFSRQRFLNNLYFATFAFHEEYEEKLPLKVVFRPSSVVNPIAKVLSDHQLRQYHVAETEKYAHVTYFFNGGHEKPFAGEKNELIPSPKVRTYDLKPEMSAQGITDVVIRNHPSYDFTIVNFANADMVGHTGNLNAAIRACEFVDQCLDKVVQSALGCKKVVIITADHGNAEQLVNPNTGEPHTEHTINPVPFMVISDIPRFQNPLSEAHDPGFILSDLTPTILKIIGLEIPTEMTGRILIE